MVETLVFETPTPLSEHVEPSFGFDAADAAAAASAAAAGQSQSQALHLSTITNAAAAAATTATHLPLNDYANAAKGNMDDSGIEVQEE